MQATRKFILFGALAISAFTNAAKAELPEGYWGVAQSQPILDATLDIRLSASLGSLSDSERAALPHLIAAGHVMHELYLEQRHADALSARSALENLHAAGTDTAATINLLELFYLEKGPIASTLNNQRQAFLPVQAEQPGKNIYPADSTREELEAFMQVKPESAVRLLAERTVVRRLTAETLDADLVALEASPVIDALNPGLGDRLRALDVAGGGFYAVPYALAYVEQLDAVRESLEQAAVLLQDESPDFATYLRHRSRDFLTGNYEAGDASWVTGHFDGLNLQIGSYETYDDSLFGAKAFYGASLLARDRDKSAALAAAIRDLQALEDSLPYDRPQSVRSDIPVGVYNVLADFGQARGANTATILPNDSSHTRKYGRTILIRSNILTNPDLFARTQTRFDAVVSETHRPDLTIEGGFNRTLWHEIGHYLGVKQTADGRSLATALADRNDLFEEMKADLVSVYAAPALLASGYYSQDAHKAHLADGIRRTLQVVKPRAAQVYQNMQLMQFNFFMESGLIEPDAETGQLTIHYDRYHEVVSELLAKVLSVQYVGDYAQADEFVSRWNYWDERLHGVFAERMRKSTNSRFTLVRYEILEEDDQAPSAQR